MSKPVTIHDEHKPLTHTYEKHLHQCKIIIAHTNLYIRAYIYRQIFSILSHHLDRARKKIQTHTRSQEREEMSHLTREPGYHSHPDSGSTLEKMVVRQCH